MFVSKARNLRATPPLKVLGGMCTWLHNSSGHMVSVFPLFIRIAIVGLGSPFQCDGHLFPNKVMLNMRNLGRYRTVEKDLR